jgi:hypothetical protein
MIPFIIIFTAVFFAYAIMRFRFVLRKKSLILRVLSPSPAKTINTSSLLSDYMKRIGLDSSASLSIVLKQSGQMWKMPNSKPMNFTATQYISAQECRFLWDARFAPFGIMNVIDYCTRDSYGLEAMVLGAVPAIKEINTPQIRKGEIMRYLAEIPWCPMALMHNESLNIALTYEGEWKISDANDPALEIYVRFNSQGLICGIYAESRPAMIGDKKQNLPWGGRFYDYKIINNVQIPTKAEVYWIINQSEFVYWRANINDWIN